MNQPDKDFSTEELARLNEDKIDAVIDLLIKKKIFTAEELTTAVESLYDEAEGESEDEDSDEDEE